MESYVKVMRVPDAAATFESVDTILLTIESWWHLENYAAIIWSNHLAKRRGRL
jgi:hypothetical protein